MVTEEELEKMSPEEINNLQKQNCIFCKIIAGQIPGKKVYEDDKILAILDIRPATKGHVIVMPKEHYPILPLVPPDTFKHMFKMSKIIANSAKKSMLSQGASIFIANGMVAGQQSPHFLFHIIPREKGDKINFEVEGKSEFIEKQKDIFNSLKNNLTAMITNHLKHEGLFNAGSTVDVPKITQEEVNAKKEKISAIIEENKDVRNLLRNDVEGFKNLIKQNEELNNLFSGVDLVTLSEQLKKIPEEEVSKPKPEVFLGNNPLAQKKLVFDYFEEKPKAKELLMKDVKKFKELLSTRPDVQKIFKDVNIDKLSEKLNEAYGGEKNE
ncbi:MAG: HIT domain-containing protein [Candidatus Woesearchaeota archaeon]